MSTLITAGVAFAASSVTYYYLHQRVWYEAANIAESLEGVNKELQKQRQLLGLHSTKKEEFLEIDLNFQQLIKEDIKKCWNKPIYAFYHNVLDVYQGNDSIKKKAFRWFKNVSNPLQQFAEEWKKK